MWFVKGGRASGKTMLLLRHSALTGTPILVSSPVKAAILMDRAREMGLYIPAPIVWKPVRKDRAATGVLLDEGEDLIDSLLMDHAGVRCVGMTINSPLTVLERPPVLDSMKYMSPGVLSRLEHEYKVNHLRLGMEMLRQGKREIPCLRGGRGGTGGK